MHEFGLIHFREKRLAFVKKVTENWG